MWRQPILPCGRVWVKRNYVEPPLSCGEPKENFADGTDYPGVLASVERGAADGIIGT